MSDLQTPPLPSIAPAGPRDMLPRSYWLFVIVLFVQIAAYYAFVAREISGGYPFANDQAGYLAKSHQIYEDMLSRGIFTALWQGVTGSEPTGMLLPSEAAFLYLLFGVSRAAALTVHLLHWILLQVVVFASFRALTRNPAWAYYTVGLLLLTASPFQFVGGMFDFRVDFSAACLVGVVCALVIYMQNSTDRRATWYLTGACCYAVCLRHILLVFLGSAFGLVTLFLFWQYNRTPKTERSNARGPLRNFLIPTFSMSLAGLLITAAKFESIYSYYVVGHVTGAEGKVRAAESGVDAIGRYAYYPISVFQQHLGYPMLIIAGVVLGLWVIRAVIRRVGQAAVDPIAPPSAGTDRTAIALIALVAMVTLTALTADTAKSPVVGSLMATPVLLLFVLLTMTLEKLAPANEAGLGRRLMKLIPMMVFALGMAHTLQSYSTRTSLTQYRAQFEQLPRAYRAIGDHLTLFEITAPKFFSDRFTDYQAPIAFQSSYYEMTGRMFRPINPVGRDVLRSDFAPFREFLQDADVAMISENISARDLQTPLPTEQMFRGNAAEIRNLVSTRMTKIDEMLINDHVVGVYVKPRAKVDGVSGGWVTSAGLKIKLLRESFLEKPFLVFKGATILSEHLKGGLNASVTDLGSGKSLPVKSSLLPTEYVIEVDLRGHSFAPGKWVEFELKFDRFFVPRKVGVSPDDRELVVLAPALIRSERTSALGLTATTIASNPLKR